MQVKVFTVPVGDGGQAEAEMNAFLRSHRVLAVAKEFVNDGPSSFWTFCAEYLEGEPAGRNRMGARGPKVDYREVLKPEEFAVFCRLREWRKKAAEKEGVPVYSVLTNEQLAEIVRGKVGSKADMKAIPGVGDARIEKYAEELLSELVRNPVPE